MRFTGLGYVVSAASYDDTFSKVVRSINERFEAPYEPIKAATFRDYSSGLAISDVQDLVQWLTDRPLSVTGNKLSEFLWFLKTRCNIIWNLCLPKNTLVTPENNMLLPVPLLCSTSIRHSAF